MVANGIILPAKSFDGRNPFTGKKIRSEGDSDVGDIFGVLVPDDT